MPLNYYYFTMREGYKSGIPVDDYLGVFRESVIYEMDGCYYNKDKPKL